MSQSTPLETHRSVAVDRNDSFVAVYTGAKIRYLLRRAVPFYLIFVALLAVYMNDEARRIFSRGRDEPTEAVVFLILGVFVAAPLLDMILTFATFRRGRPALVVSRDGVEGPVMYRRRRFAWDDVADVFEKGGELLIERKPKNRLEALTVAYTWPGSHRRLTELIRTPLACVDKSALDIRVAIREFGPPDIAERRVGADSDPRCSH